MCSKFLWIIFHQKEAPVKEDLLNNLLSTKEAMHINVWFSGNIVKRNWMLVTLHSQKVKCISIRAVFYDRSNILNAWWKKGKQTNRQKIKFSWIILEEARCFSRAISYVLNEHHGLVLKCQIIMRMMKDTSL